MIWLKAPDCDWPLVAATHVGIAVVAHSAFSTRSQSNTVICNWKELFIYPCLTWSRRKCSSLAWNSSFWHSSKDTWKSFWPWKAFLAEIFGSWKNLITTSICNCKSWQKPAILNNYLEMLRLLALNFWHIALKCHWSISNFSSHWFRPYDYHHQCYRCLSKVNSQNTLLFLHAFWRDF